MKGIFLIPGIFLLFCYQAISQKAVSGNLEAGLSIYGAWKDGSKAAFLPSVTLGPGVKFINSGSVSILLSVPCTVGWNLNKGTYFGINAPAMLSLQFGSASGKDKDSKLGFIVGAGAGYTNIVNYHETSGEKRAHKEFWGYLFRAGFSFGKIEDGIAGPLLVFNFGKSITTGNGYVAGLNLLISIN